MNVKGWASIALGVLNIVVVILGFYLNQRAIKKQYMNSISKSNFEDKKRIYAKAIRNLNTQLNDGICKNGLEIIEKHIDDHALVAGEFLLVAPINVIKAYEQTYIKAMALSSIYRKKDIVELRNDEEKNKVKEDYLLSRKNLIDLMRKDIGIE